MNQNNSINTPNAYPVEQSFKSPLILTALFVLIPTLLLYWFLGDSNSIPRVFKLFFGNWISPVILWFFCASFLHLILKRKKLRQEQQHTENVNKLLTTTLVVDQISTPNDENFLTDLKNVNGTKVDASQNLLFSRLSLFLNHHDSNIDETFGIKEREQLRGSFSQPRFMVWAIPILGFIGTVWGISNGIAHFSDAMTSTSSVGDVSTMLKENLPLVTNSLATAFDTTLLALLLSIPLMMFMLALEKDEEAYLIDLEERWSHDIKPVLLPFSATAVTPLTGSSMTGTEVVTHSSDSSAVAGEIKVLSTQIKALQETMEDLYETIFTSNLKDKK